MVMQQCDVIAIGDLRQPLCGSTTIIEQLQATAASGYRVGLLQLKSILTMTPAPIHPDIRRMVEDGLLAILDPNLPATAELLLATDPILFTHMPKRALQIDARRRVVLVRAGPDNANGEAVYDWARIGRQAAEILGGEVFWAPLSQSVRHQLESQTPRPHLTEHDWHDVIDPSSWKQSRESFCSTRPVIGRHGPSIVAAWPNDRSDLLTIYTADPRFLVRILGGGQVLHRIVGPYPRNWEVQPFDELSASSFLATIDFFVYSHHPDLIDPVDPSILEAMASGAVTILPPAFEPIFGEGAVYAAPDRIRPTVWSLYNDRAGYIQQSRLGLQTVERRFSPSSHVEQIRDLVGAPGSKPSGNGAVWAPGRVTPVKSSRRVLFITINGVGMGHLTRMLAIARRCSASIEPVFLTMSQALKVVREQGFLAEYIPSRTYLDCDLNRWNGFLRDEVNEMIAFYDPAVVLFDGNVPYQGIIDAIKANPDPWFVWSRRGMWRVGNSDIASRETFFDAVLEPGDLAEAYDHGITSRYRDKTRRVGPIRLLDPSEMLPRGEARRELGLKSDQPAVLIQLGAGNNFDYRSIHRTAFTHITERHMAQVAVGEWLISEQPISLPATAIRMPGYPFARYFNAFDLAISAVGYNSFHELLFAEVPTILVPNEAMEQDNQLARALYADRHGLAVCVRAKEIYQLTARIDQMLDPAERQRIKRRLGALDQNNGAAEAAALIEEMAYSRRVDRP